MSDKRWKFRAVDDDATREVARQAELPMPIASVLVSRGMTDMQDIELHLNPRLADLTDPSRLPDMDKAVARVWAAIDAEETISVFGDYDVDGVTSASLLTRVFAALGADVKSFIPDRLDEGYGLSSDAVERCIVEHGSTLLVSVDCGVNSIESVRAAAERGVDVIVTDHHEPEAETAPALAVVNPKLGPERDLDILSGVGVAFKLTHGLVKYGRANNRAAAIAMDLRDYLDIVALGTVADIVPLVGENRIMVRHGLARLAESKWAGFEALKTVAGMKGEPDTYHLGFQLGPRINAAGRIGEPARALRLLTTNDSGEARRLAKTLDDNNTERRQVERKIADAAFEEIDAYFDADHHFGLVVAAEGWHPGVVGIVASRVARHYNRPAIIMGIEQDGSARGSCRSIQEYDMLKGLRACEAHLTKFGGHKMAAGLEVKPGELDAFRDAFNAAVTKDLGERDLTPTLHIDAEVDAGLIDWPFYDALTRLKPFGQDNPEPVWVARKLRVKGAPRVVGNSHLKLVLSHEGKTVQAIAFNYPIEQLPAELLDVAFTLKENHWMGDRSLQLQVVDIKAAE